ncbi:hypothetical protein [Blastococcus saxobsidens]|uniref:Uncharacterized protein n=1 Tax=Blastococcus saxobsidens (strain DD2) TaxID=1146883 RepID=H6RP21_BLASD|nr:hypothetical protein [Blastococcus saxobsidens]CCG02682.1 exported protein of unknown function [Blastococcus saxobsidens DD2]
MRLIRFATWRRAAAALAPLVLAAMAGCSGGMEALYAEGVRLIWESEITPLTLIYVNVIDPDDPPSGFSRPINLNEGDQREVLEEKYGPHPDEA